MAWQLASAVHRGSRSRAPPAAASWVDAISHGSCPSFQREISPEFANSGVIPNSDFQSVWGAIWTSTHTYSCQKIKTHTYKQATCTIFIQTKGMFGYA